jgi:hypothetical protein
MQATTILQIAAILSGLLFTAGSYAQLDTPIRLGEPQITAGTDGSVAYEIAIRTALPHGSTAKLASVQIHKAKGFNYPLWLSDANVEVKQRAGQRQTLRIQVQRPSPYDQNEIMLAFTNNGHTRFAPYTLQTDNSQHKSEGKPMPSPPADTDILANPLEAIANGIVRNADAVPPQAQRKQNNTVTSSPNFSARTSTKIEPKQPLKKPAPTRTAPALVAASASDAASGSANPMSAASEPASVLSAPTTTPSATVVATSAAGPTPLAAPATAALPPPQTAASKMLQGTLVWALGAVAALLVLYLLVRLMMKNRSAQRDNAPVLTRETQFQTSRGGAANTVFGVSDSEAEALQQQWQQQKIRNMS